MNAGPKSEKATVERSTPIVLSIPVQTTATQEPTSPIWQRTEMVALQLGRRLDVETLVHVLLVSSIALSLLMGSLLCVTFH